MKRLGIADRQDIRFANFEAINKALERQSMSADGPVPIFEPTRIWIGSRLYYFVAEAWFDQCMEDRCGETTNKTNIRQLYKYFMEKEADFQAERHNYVPNAPAGHYGVTWIAKRDVDGEAVIKKVKSKAKSTVKSKKSVKSGRKS